MAWEHSIIKHSAAALEMILRRSGREIAVSVASQHWPFPDPGNGQSFRCAVPARPGHALKHKITLIVRGQVVKPAGACGLAQLLSGPAIIGRASQREPPLDTASPAGCVRFIGAVIPRTLTYQWKHDDNAGNPRPLNCN